MIKVAQPAKEVRNLRFHVKIKDAEILGQAINEVLAKRTRGKIDENGRGFKVPDLDEFKANIYSSSIILADQNAAPKGEYIYTMEDVTFSSSIQIKNKKQEFTSEEVDLQLYGGWVIKDGEYVLVVFTKDGITPVTDAQKLQGKFFYNAVFTRYVTHAIGEDVLELRNFDVRVTDNDYPDVQSSLDEDKKIIDHLRSGGKGGATDYDSQYGAGNKKQTKENVMDFVKNNYPLYKPSSAAILFGYKDPTQSRQTPFNKATDPGINFIFKFPDFATGENVVDTERGLNYAAVGNEAKPGDVTVAFSNIPKNMPYEIFNNIYDYLKNGLDGKELSAGTNLTYGNTIFHEDATKETLFERNSKRIKELLREIEDLYQNNREYKVDFDDNLPSPYQAKGVKKNILKYLNELEAYVARLKRNLPFSLAELDRLIEEKGEAAVNPKNINLLKILKTKQ
jgi:hypothetical protein